ncbi:MAG: HEAT repeat domain-containing protein [Acidobacteriota bacterium]
MLRRVCLIALSSWILVFSLTPAAEAGIGNAELRPLGSPLPDLDTAFERLLADTEGPAWATYLVPMADPQRQLCCGRDCRCRLEGSNKSYQVLADTETSQRLRVLLRIEDRQLDDVRIFGENCEIDAGGLPVFAWEGVEASQSLDLLVERVDSHRHRLAKDALMAIAYHQGAAVDAILEAAARSDHPGLQRLEEEAIFWLGEARGASGFEALTRLRRDLDDVDLQEKIAFALHLNDTPGALDLLIEMARRDPRREVRSQALFWLSQEAGERAADAIVEATEEDPDLDVKERAVFALSQLPPDRGVPLLIHYAENHAQRAVRKKAMFWLGQSDDPRALELFEKILSR